MEPPRGEDVERAEGGLSKTETLVWAGAVGAFALALLLSLRREPADLRTPAVLVAGAAAAWLAAVFYCLHWSAGTRTLRACRGLAFGLWAAAIFRLIPPVMNEAVLFDARSLSFDVPYILLGAAVHAGAALIAISIYIHRAVLVDASYEQAEQGWHLGAASLLLFYLIAAMAAAWSRAGV